MLGHDVHVTGHQVVVLLSHYRCCVRRKAVNCTSHVYSVAAELDIEAGAGVVANSESFKLFCVQGLLVLELRYCVGHCA